MHKAFLKATSEAKYSFWTKSRIGDFLAFCVLEETTGTTVDNLDEDGAEQPWLPRAVMDRRSRHGPELTTLEAVGDQRRYALVAVQARDDDDDDNNWCMRISWTILRWDNFW